MVFDPGTHPNPHRTETEVGARGGLEPKRDDGCYIGVTSVFHRFEVLTMLGAGSYEATGA